MAAAPSRGPLARHRQAGQQGQLLTDPQQTAAAESLQQLYVELLNPPRRRLRWWPRQPARPPQGRYLHGPVGRGKTLLMDLMASELEAAGLPLLRLHFQDFMLEVHTRLNALAGQRDPLRQIAAEMAGRIQVLCFDEFQVDDIGDAMVLGELLGALFDQEVCLIATSNVAPDDLYAGGLQRARFLPAIDRLKRHCQLIDLGQGPDFRLRALQSQPLYHHPLGPSATAQLATLFARLSSGHHHAGSLAINGRDVQALGWSAEVAWFAFAELCETERAAADYLALCERFDTLLIDGIRVLRDEDNNAARRFIHLVDACYDRGVKLALAADAPITKLYQGRLSGIFGRTQSRLIEMQSEAYLARPVRRQIET